MRVLGGRKKRCGIGATKKSVQLMQLAALAPARIHHRPSLGSTPPAGDDRSSRKGRRTARAVGRLVQVGMPAPARLQDEPPSPAHPLAAAQMTQSDSSAK